MDITIIGIDPHKRSHTAVVLDEEERIAWRTTNNGRVAVAAGPKQLDRLLRWAPAGPREWAVESANGLGWLLSRPACPPGPKAVAEAG